MDTNSTQTQHCLLANEFQQPNPSNGE